MLNLQKYIKETFGVNIKLKELTKNELEKLPFFLKGIFKYWSANFLGKAFVFAEIIDTENLTPGQYKKHIETIEKILQTNTVFVFSELETYNRNRLIKKQISFIIPGKQCFIPNLFIDLKDYLKTKKQIKQNLQPAAQMLLLYHLQKKSLQNSGYKQITEILDYSYVTITRAVENLTSLNLCKVTDSKVKKIFFEFDKKELWEKALQFFVNPIKKAVYVNETIPNEFLSETNISALAHYTEISNNNIKYFAINHKDFTNLHKKGIIKMYSEYDGDNFIEIWKYNPKILSETQFVDPLSLFLTFKDNKDERIQIELEKLISRVLW